MNTNIYDEYSKIRELMAELTEKQKLLEIQILNEIKNLSTPMISTKGSFNKVVKRNYVFSELLQEKQKSISEQIKKFSEVLSEPIEQLKKTEIENGTAKFEETISLRYTSKKEK